jgi:hypothetical protein
VKGSMDVTNFFSIIFDYFAKQQQRPKLIKKHTNHMCVRLGNHRSSTFWQSGPLSFPPGISYSSRVPSDCKRKRIPFMTCGRDQAYLQSAKAGRGSQRACAVLDLKRTQRDIFQVA